MAVGTVATDKTQKGRTGGTVRPFINPKLAGVGCDINNPLANALQPALEEWSDEALRDDGNLELIRCGMGFATQGEALAYVGLFRIARMRGKAVRHA